MKSQRLWLFAAAAIASFLGGGLWNAGSAEKPANASKVVIADEFRVVDENGKPRIVLSIFQGSPSVRLLDENGQDRVALLGGPAQEPPVREDNTAGICIMSEDHKAAVYLGLEHTVPVLKMYRGGGDALVLVYVNPDDSPHIRLRDKTENVIFAAP